MKETELEKMMVDSKRWRKIAGIKERSLYLISYDRKPDVDQADATNSVESFIEKIGSYVRKPVESNIVFRSALFYRQLLNELENSNVVKLCYFIIVQIDEQQDMYQYIDEKFSKDFLQIKGDFVAKE